MDKHSYVEIIKARGVVRVLGERWDALAPIPPDEIESIRRVISSGAPVLEHPHLTRGDRRAHHVGAARGRVGDFPSQQAGERSARPLYRPVATQRRGRSAGCPRRKHLNAAKTSRRCRRERAGDRAVVRVGRPRPVAGAHRALDGAGIVFDDNLFSSPDGLAVGDSIIRVTPGLSASRETAHSYLFGTYSFDAERYRENAILTTPIARQNALAFLRVETSPYTAWAFNGGYLYSVTPSELNLTTGLFGGRSRGWSAHGGPEWTRLLSPRPSVQFTYDLADELPGYDIVTHNADFALTREMSSRNELRVMPFVREFVFDTSSDMAKGVVAGWTRRLTPFTSLRLQGGPRFIQNTDQVRPELDLLLRRRSGFSEMSLAYTRTSTAIAGYQTLLETQRVTATGGYHHPATVDATVTGGVYFNENQQGSVARVYHVGGDLSRRFTRALGVSISYTLDLQRGLLPTTQIAGIPGSRVVLGALSPIPLFAIDRTATDVPIRKNVLMIQLVVSRTIHPTNVPPRLQPAPDGSSTRGKALDRCHAAWTRERALTSREPSGIWSNQ